MDKKKESLPLSVKLLAILLVLIPTISIAITVIGGPLTVGQVGQVTIQAVSLIILIIASYGLIRRKSWGRWLTYFISTITFIVWLFVIISVFATQSLELYIQSLSYLIVPLLALYVYVKHDDLFKDKQS